MIRIVFLAFVFVFAGAQFSQFGASAAEPGGIGPVTVLAGIDWSSVWVKAGIGAVIGGVIGGLIAVFRKKGGGGG